MRRLCGVAWSALVLGLLGLLVQHEALVFKPSPRVFSWSVMSCRRDLTEEKRMRNLAYCRKFKSNGANRKQMILEAKKATIAERQQEFYNKVFKFTTDADSPEYHGFDDVINFMR